MATACQLLLQLLQCMKVKSELVGCSADDTTLMAESEEELKSLLMKVKEESEKVGLKSTFRKLR